MKVDTVFVDQFSCIFALFCTNSLIRISGNLHKLFLYQEIDRVVVHSSRSKREFRWVEWRHEGCEGFWRGSMVLESTLLSYSRSKGRQNGRSATHSFLTCAARQTRTCRHFLLFVPHRRLLLLVRAAWEISANLRFLMRLWYRDQKICRRQERRDRKSNVFSLDAPRISFSSRLYRCWDHIYQQ